MTSPDDVLRHKIRIVHTTKQELKKVIGNKKSAEIQTVSVDIRVPTTGLAIS